MPVPHRLHGQRARRNATPTPPSSTGSSSATRPSVPAGRVNIEIAPPAPLTKEQVKAWAHGPLTGGRRDRRRRQGHARRARAAGEHLRRGARALPAGRAGRARRSSTSRATQAVLDEEAKWADEANAERMKARIGIALAIGLSALLSLGALGFAIWAFLRHGREYKPAFPGGYLREDPRPDLVARGHRLAVALRNAGHRRHRRHAHGPRRQGRHHDAADHRAPRRDSRHRGEGRGELRTRAQPQLPPAGSVGPTDKTAARPAVRRYRCRRRGDARGDQVVRQGQPARPTPSKIKAWNDECEAIADVARACSRATAGRGAWACSFSRASSARSGSSRRCWARRSGRCASRFPRPLRIAVMGAYMLRRSRQGNELFAQYKAVHDYLHDFGRLARGAAAVDRAVEPVPRARRGLRHRDRGHQPVARQGAGGRRRPGLPDDVLVGLRVKRWIARRSRRCRAASPARHRSPRARCRPRRAAAAGSRAAAVAAVAAAGSRRGESAPPRRAGAVAFARRVMDVTVSFERSCSRSGVCR